MAANRFRITVHDDGKITTESVGGFSKDVHQDADDFLKTLTELMGGTPIVRKNTAKPNERKIETHHSH